MLKLLVACTIFFLSGILTSCGQQPKEDKNLIREADPTEVKLRKLRDKVNAMCPIQVDSATILVTTFTNSNTFGYNYVLKLDTSYLSLKEIKSYIEKRQLNHAKTNPRFKHFREMQTTVIHQYSDESGIYLFEIKLEPANYN